MTIINCRNVKQFMKNREGYPSIDTDDDEQAVSKYLNGFFKDVFGPLWDGQKYLENGGQGKSIFVGTDNLLHLMRYRARMK